MTHQNSPTPGIQRTRRPSMPKDRPSILPANYLITHLEDVAYLLGGDPSSFTGDLLRLIAKADPNNRRRLGDVYPRHVEAYLAWLDPRAFWPERALVDGRASARQHLLRIGCPTCAPPFRETAGLVCQACGTDYGAGA